MTPKKKTKTTLRGPRTKNPSPGYEFDVSGGRTAPRTAGNEEGERSAPQQLACELLGRRSFEALPGDDGGHRMPSTTTEYNTSYLLRQLSHAFTSSGGTAEAMLRSIQKYSAEYQRAKEFGPKWTIEGPGSTREVNHVKDANGVKDVNDANGVKEEPRETEEMVEGAKAAPGAVPQQQNPTLTMPIEQMLQTQFQQTQREFHGWSEHLKTLTQLMPLLSPMENHDGIQMAEGRHVQADTKSRNSYQQFAALLPTSQRIETIHQEGQHQSPFGLLMDGSGGGLGNGPGPVTKADQSAVETDVDSKEAALCLMAIERGVDTCQEAMSRAAAERQRAWEAMILGSERMDSKGTKGAADGTIVGKRRGRPPKHSVEKKAGIDGKDKDGDGNEAKDGPPKRVKSCKYVGVRKRKWGTYASEIRNPLSGSREWLGTFDTAEEAAVVYDVRLRMIRGMDAPRANFPPLKPHPVMLTRIISPHGASRPEREVIQIPNDWWDQISQFSARTGP